MLTLYTKNDPYLRRRFLALPPELYPPERRAQEPKTERQLLENILASHDKTVIFITHRPAVVEYCDQVLRIERTKRKHRQ